MDSLGVLIIAPESDLKNTADIVAAANGFRVNVLNGYVTGREALKEIGSGRYDVVYFGGHERELDSVTVSDGRLDEEYLRQALRSASSGRLQIVILNSCDSISMAAALYRAGVAPRVIGWPSEMSDAAAGSWAQNFFRSLALGAEFWEAFASSVEVLRVQFPTVKPPVFLNGRITLLEERVAAIQRQLDERAGMLTVPRWTLAVLLVLAGLAATATVLALLQ
ncbi:MAG: hypothetical protein IPK78_18290 [Rhodospirillales bacterium]|nr:hypothetical protein [Rhodospirillales bacterium]